MDIIWEAPPEKGTRRSKWASVFNTLRDNPDRWAKLYEGKDRNAHSLAGRLRKTYGGEFEIQSRTLDPVDGVKQAGVYARYVAAAPNNLVAQMVAREAEASIAIDREDGTYPVDGGAQLDPQ